MPGRLCVRQPWGFLFACVFTRALGLERRIPAPRLRGKWAHAAVGLGGAEVLTGGIDALAMATDDGSCGFRAMRIKRRDLGDQDIQIEMKYCGVCYSDLHIARGGLGSLAAYPMVPGHELAGVCVAVGSKVTKFAVGDKVGVGCFVDSCLTCSPCRNGEEQYCENGMTLTYR